MLGPDGHDHNREDSAGSQADRLKYLQELKREVLDTPSLFVASLADALSRRPGDDFQEGADLIRRQGVLTGREFNRLVEAISDPNLAAEFLWAYSFVSKEGVDVDFAQGVPALITLTQRALTSPVPSDEAFQQRLFRIFDRLLDSRIASDDIADHVKASMSVNECLKLRNIAMHGFQDRKGYWESVELLSAVYPDKTSLEFVFRGIDRLAGASLKSSDRRGIERCISAVAAADFAGAFEFAARALGDDARLAEADLRRAVVAGLAFHADSVVRPLARFIASDSTAEALLACSVCVTADNDRDIEFTAEQRNELAGELHLLTKSRRFRTDSPRLSGESLRALAHVSNEQSDIEIVGVEVRERLARNEPVPSMLALAYAEGLARLEGEAGIVSLRALSEKKLRMLTAQPALEHHMSGHERLLVRPDTENVFENLAVDIGGAPRFEDVLSLCHRHAEFVDTRSLRARENDALSLFYDVKDAARFSQFHAELCEKGPAEFAVILLPELLSALFRGRDPGKEMFGDFIGENALRSLASVTSILVHDAEARELASARFSPADWSFLTSFHKMNLPEYPRAYPDLGLAMFALRSVFEGGEKIWQRELMAWWRKVDEAGREQTGPNALAFVSVIAEQRRPGTVWDLLSQISLVSEDANTFRDIATGLLVQPALSAAKVCTMVQSPDGDELARGLALAQLLTRHMNAEQRDGIISVAKRCLDELGVLSLDAVATIGALSSSRDDAALLLEAEPSLGVNESLYRVSCALAAAQVLRNRERQVKGSSRS
jgi:hypothetical protein